MSIVLIEARGADGTQVEWIETAHNSLAEAARDEPEYGAYLVARTYHGGQVLELDAHFDRLERSAAAQGGAIRIPRTQLRSILREMLRQLAPESGDGRFRVTAVLDESPWYRLAMEPAAGVDPQLLRDGVHCSLHRGMVRRNAEVKSTAWIAQRRALSGGRGADGAGAAEGAGAGSDARRDEAGGDGTHHQPTYEHLLAREDGAILEGATSNFYACIGSVVHTAGEGVLQGIARRIVCTVIEEMAPEVTVSYRPATISELEAGAVAEAFITSSTRGVVPVRSIDSVELGGPGPITTEISRRYQVWLEHHLAPL